MNMKPEELQQSIEHHFAELLNTHMAKSPMLNPVLRVEALGFCKWQGNDLCIVITPWFMSLFLMPDQKDKAPEVGSITNFHFANGSFAFTAANDKVIGNYNTCTLFSDMSGFTSQTQARSAALETIRLLLGQEKTQTTDKPIAPSDVPNRRDLFRLVVRRSKNT